MKKTLIVFLIFSECTFQLYSQYNSADWQERDQWMDIKRILELASVSEGQNVADIGCHEGYLSIHLARAVGVRGKVYAVDLREDRLEKLNANASNRNIYNITTVKGEANDPKLPEAALDLVVIMDTYHEMKEYMTILDHVKRSLRPNGRIVILEKLKSHAKDKNRKEQASAHTLAPQYVRKELRQAGYRVIEQIDDIGNWENNSSKKIWIIVAGLPGT